MKNIFTEHPYSIGENYFQHLRFAMKLGFGMIIGGVACVLHAVFPFVFKSAGSDCLLKLTSDFIRRMPTVDERILALLTLIQQKKSRNPNFGEF